MKPSRRHPPSPSDERTQVPFPSWWQRARQRLSAFHLRDLWWGLLDRWETKRSFRQLLIGLLSVGAIIAAITFWGYPWWTKRNSVKLAREWLAAGRINYAVEAVEQALALDPKNPEPWQIAAELARRRGQLEKATEYVRHAAELAPGNTDLLIAWAAAALRAELTAEAVQALGKVPHVTLEKSPNAQRILGEIARRNFKLDEAKNHFEAALKLDGPIALDEVPLGLILLNATDPAERQRGIDLLTKWTTDNEWGSVSLRTLLSDAQSRKDKPAMLQWATALQANPGCTLADMPNCLLALSQSDETRFTEAVTILEKNHAVTPQAAAQLVGWLNQIGRSAEAVRWMKTLPPTGLLVPPLAVVGAEALRAVADWSGLKELTNNKNWGADVEFLRWMYAMEAARALSDETTGKELWQTLYSHAQLNGVHGLFAGSTLYSWGRVDQAEALWWRAAEQAGPNAIQALGTLARHYQSRRDAEGQYRAFRRLHSLRPKDAAIANNFAFFAALTKHEERLAENLARENLAQDSVNRTYLGTLAFVLVAQNRPEEALTLLKTVAAEAERNSALTFAYGLALAGTGKKTEAKALLSKIPADDLTIQAAERINAALND